jgi:hypothetical protein
VLQETLISIQSEWNRIGGVMVSVLVLNVIDH